MDPRERELWQAADALFDQLLDLALGVLSIAKLIAQRCRLRL